MEKIINLRLKGKIIIGFSFIIAATITTLVLAYSNTKKIDRMNSEILQLNSLSYDMTNLRADLNRIRAVTQTLVMETNPEQVAKIITDITTKKESITAQYTSISLRLAPYPSVSELFEGAGIKLENYNKSREDYLDTLNSDREEADSVSSTILDNFYNEIRDDLLSAENIINKERSSLVQKSNELRTRVINQAALFGIILILISLLIMSYILRIITRISSEIKEGIEILSDSSQNILSTITEMSAGASETAASVSETTATVEEVRQTATLANQKAQSLLESTKRVKASADKGQGALSQVIEAMENIDFQMKKISGTVVKLSEQNRRIGEITSSVADIADQSNLLAVNAAIEAAKAGEHGKGFTVVAREIRNLSDQSKRATEQVKEILNQIEKSVNDTVGVTEESKITVDSGKELVMQSGEIMEILASNIDETRDAAIQISSSNHQQMAGMDQIVPAMENIKKASEQNAEGIRQSQNATKELHSLGLSLKKIIVRFNL
jgi:methyl-accepting chemotaxis protein